MSRLNQVSISIFIAVIIGVVVASVYEKRAIGSLRHDVINFSNSLKIPLVYGNQILRHESVFCIKVSPDEHGYYYEVRFSNDNFATSETINLLSDVAEFMKDENQVNVIPITFRPVEYLDAIDFAKKFKTYNQCIGHNESIKAEQIRLLAKYKAKPPKKRDISEMATKNTIVNCDNDQNN